VIAYFKDCYFLTAHRGGVAVTDLARYDFESIDYLRKIMSGTWRVKILSALLPGTKRFVELLRKLDGVSQPILSRYLKELEMSGLITRKVYPVIPPKVEYSLTEPGQKFAIISQKIETWCLHYFNNYDNAIIKKRFGGKWKTKILLTLHRKTCRFGILRNELQNITQSELARHLTARANDNMIQRKIYAEIPPKVEYSLTEQAKEYVLIVIQFLEWGLELSEFSESDAKDFTQTPQ
jgi:DNA-binding HxlR family transcriptional regulator